MSILSDTPLGNGKSVWFRTIMGKAISSFGGGLALFCVICLFITTTGKLYLVIGIVIGLILFVGGLSVKGKKITIDENTGHAKKKYL